MFSLIKNATQHRYVLRNFISRDLKLKYRGSVAGYLWTLMEPMALVATYYFVFVVIARRGDATYPLIVLLGVLPYNLFSGIITGGATSLIANATLIRRVYLPRELFLIALIGSNLIVFLLSLLVVIPFLLYYRIMPGWSLALLPIAILLITFLSTGIGLLVACLNVLYRDVSYVLSVLLRLAFYGSPVLYGVDWVPERLRDAYLLNPLAVYLSMIRCAILDAPMFASPPQVLLAVLFAVLALAGGSLAFRRWERKVVKYL